MIRIELGFELCWTHKVMINVKTDTVVVPRILYDLKIAEGIQEFNISGRLCLHCDDASIVPRLEERLDQGY